MKDKKQLQFETFQARYGWLIKIVDAAVNGAIKGGEDAVKFPVAFDHDEARSKFRFSHGKSDVVDYNNFIINDFSKFETETLIPFISSVKEFYSLDIQYNHENEGCYLTINWA